MFQHSWRQRFLVPSDQTLSQDQNFSIPQTKICPTEEDVSIPPDQNMSQEGKFFNTLILYTTPKYSFQAIIFVTLHVLAK